MRSAIAKALALFFSDQLAIYLNDNNIIDFRKSYSLNGVLLIYLKKAFDTVDLQILISKSMIYGIGALNLFKSYLSNRMQKCQIQELTRCRI